MDQARADPPQGGPLNFVEPLEVVATSILQHGIVLSGEYLIFLGWKRGLW
jgi:hypothetical protein